MDGIRVLVLEDRPADAELMVAELRRAGFTLDWHRVDTKDAYLRHLDPPPDLILADFHMPQFTALTALGILKERGLDIPFIIVSGSIGEEIAVGALRDGAADYLLKDRMTRLASAATRALDEKQLRDKKRLAEEDLARERNLLRTLIDTLPDYINIKDAEGRYRVVNDAYARFMGAATPDEIIGKTVYDIFPPELAAEYAGDDRNVLATGQPLINKETLSVDQANNQRWHLVSKIPLRDGAGHVTGLVGIARDMTDRKAAEDQIEQQLQTLIALYTSAQKLSQSLDLDQLAHYVVETSVKAFGARFAWIGHAERDGVVRLLTHWPRKEEYLKDLAPRWDESAAGRGLSGRAIRSAFPVVAQDIAAEPALVRRETLLHLGFQAAGAFPLISRGTPFGVLMLYSDRTDFFRPTQLEFFQAFANLAAAALENARLFEEAEGRLQQLQALRNIDIAITASLDLRVTLNVILDQVTTHLRADAANVLLFDPHTQTLRHATNRGFRTTALRRANLRLGEGHAGRAALEQRTLSVPNLAADPGEFARSARLAEEGFVAYHAIPLTAKGQVKGVLEIFHRGPLNPTPEWMSFMDALAGQAAIAVDNSSLFDGLQRANVDLMMAYDTTLEGWSRALDLRDKETEGHTLRVTRLAMQLARSLNVRDEELAHIRRGALLHDIGKMGIPDSILLKPGPLTDDEWIVMRRHPAVAYELLSPIPYLRPALDIPRYHHEKWDGSGYPDGLRGEQIPLAARVFAVVDVWDALTSDRPYRPAWSREKTLAHVREQAGKHFEPRIVDAFLALISEPPA